MSPFPEGVTWGEFWSTAFEGPFTIAQKCVWANALSLGQVRRLFGIPTSTSAEKVTVANSLLVDVAAPRLLKRYFFPRAAAPWARVLASDERFRYCPECIKFGYQSYLFQLCKLERCPIHRCELLSVCTACGRPTCEYALISSAIEKPMHCSHCGVPWAGELDIAKWNEACIPANAYEPMERLDRWLVGLNECPILTSSQFSDVVTHSKGPACYATHSRLRTKDADYAFQQTVAFGAAEKLSQPAPEKKLLRQQDGEWRFMTIEFSEWSKCVGVEELKPVYKSIRRNFEHRYRRRRRHAMQTASRPIGHTLGHEDTTDILDDAFRWWRSSFENYCKRPTEAQLRILKIVAGDPTLAPLTFFRAGFIRTFDGPVKIDLRLHALLIAASFYLACYLALEHCEMNQSLGPLNPMRRSSFAFELPWVTPWELQLRSPCWTHTRLRSEERLTRQLATFCGTPEAVLALKNWKWSSGT